MIAALAGAIPGILQGLFGVGQTAAGLIGAKKLEGQRPEYEIPEEARKALMLARSMIGDMPGTGVQQQRIDTSAANMIQSAFQAGNPLAALGSIQANENKANLDLQTQNASFRQTAMDRAREALGTYAQYKDMEFQMNEYAPWKDKMQRAENMYGAGSKNVFGGVDAVSQVATAFLSK